MRVMFFVFLVLSLVTVMFGELEIATATVEATTDVAVLKVYVPYLFGYENQAIEGWLNRLIWENTSAFVDEAIREIRNGYRYLEEKIFTDPHRKPPRGEIYIRGRAYEVNERLVSIVIDFYKYVLTAAHGHEERKSFTVDLDDGSILKLSQLLNFEQRQMVREEVIKLINKELHTSKFTPESIESVKSHPLEENFYLTKDSVVIFFAKYEITPGYVGIPEFVIPFSKLGIDPEKLTSVMDDL